MTHTPIALARIAAERLREEGIDNARLEAELLLAAVLGIGRLDLYLQHDRPLATGEVDAYRSAVRRRLHREPLQYITGVAHFRELELHVDPRVLIPRPETEVLVGEVLRWAETRLGSASGSGSGSEARGTDSAVREPSPTASGLRDSGLVPRATNSDPDPEGPRTLTAVDIGTGSGAIALSLVHEGRFGRVVATDVSRDALELAAGNARRLGLEDRIEFRQGELWVPLGTEEPFDVVVSNPPYVSEAERPTLAPEVRDWEPAGALFAPGDGLDVLAALVEGAPSHLAPGGLLALEVGLGQAAEVARRAEKTGAYGSVRIVRDLAGRERIVLAKREPLAKITEKGEHA